MTASLDGIEGDKVGHKQGTSAIASGAHAGPTRSGVKLDVGISRTHADFDSGEETGGRKMETIYTLGLCASFSTMLVFRSIVIPLIALEMSPLTKFCLPVKTGHHAEWLVILRLTTFFTLAWKISAVTKYLTCMELVFLLSYSPNCEFA